jgi:Uma2 family endonuclease
MSTVATPPVERVVLQGISWNFYERLLTELGDAPGTRVTYDRGLLQIMVISAAHDLPNRTLASIVEIVAEESGTDLCPLGSTTFQRPDLLKGFEPDSCFYFRHAEAMRAKDHIDLLVDPAPELVIEVDVTNSSMIRFPIFAAVGVREVWLYTDGKLTMYALHNGGYQVIAHSLALPVLTPEAATHFVASCRRTKRPEWTRELRTWVRNAGASA